MKKLIQNVVLGAGLFLLLAMPALAQNGFTLTGTAISTTTSYAVISGQKSSAGPPIVHFVEAQLVGVESSNAAARVSFYTPSIEIPVTTTNGASATTIVAFTNGLAANDVLVLQTTQGDLYQRLTVASLSGNTITVNETITRAQTAKDKVWKMTIVGKLSGGSPNQPTLARDKISVGNALGPIFVGLQNKPALIEVTGTNTPVLNVVAGKWDRF